MSAVDAHAHPNPSETDTHGEGTELDHEAHGDHGGHGDPGSHGAEDGHAHAAPSEPLGPVDTRAWAAAIGGALLGIVVIVALYLAIKA